MLSIEKYVSNDGTTRQIPETIQNDNGLRVTPKTRQPYKEKKVKSFKQERTHNISKMVLHLEAILMVKYKVQNALTIHISCFLFG